MIAAVRASNPTVVTIHVDMWDCMFCVGPDVQSSPHNIRDALKGGSCSTNGRGQNCAQRFDRTPGRNRLDGLGVDERIILFFFLFRDPFYLQAVQIHLANVVKLLQA
jgi:hypothetical protein